MRESNFKDYLYILANIDATKMTINEIYEQVLGLMSKNFNMDHKQLIETFTELNKERDIK